MKKFIVFMLSVLVVFAMCSCQPTENMDGKVEFKVYTNAQASKALTANDPGQAKVTDIQLAFVPSEQVTEHINCQYKIGENPTKNGQQSTLTGGEPSNWIDGLITVSHDSNNLVTATWATDAKLYLSQGKWTIYARAVEKDTSGTVTKVLYAGDKATFVNKKSASATITLTPKVTTGTGTLVLDGLLASKVFETVTKERLIYSYTALNSLPSAEPSATATGDTITPCTDQTGVGNGLVKFNNATKTLAQGSYVLSVTLQQNTSDTSTDNWVDYTGGSVVDFGIYEGETTTITGDVEASDYMATTVGAEIRNAVFALTLTNKNVDADKVVDGNFTLKYDAKITIEGEKALAKNLLWYVDGKLIKNQTITTAPTDGVISMSTETISVAHGKHNIQAIVVGYIDKDKTSTYDAKSNLASTQFDTRDRL